MASRPVSLHAHKNTVENRRKRSLAKKATSAVEVIIRERDIRAYAFIGISADGQAYASWDTGAIMPMVAFPETVAALLRMDINSCDLKEDWRPNLTIKGSE
jgi:hypothetical protein